MPGNAIVPLDGGGVAVYRCPYNMQHSIMSQEGETMLAGLLLSLQTEEDRLRFTQFYHQYEKLMFKTALQLLGSQQDAEDVVQSACLYMIDQYDGKFAPYDMHQVASYVILLIKNRSLDLLKQSRRVTVEDISDYADALSSSQNETELSLQQAFSKLPDHYKEVLTLFYYEDLSVRDIAVMLKLSEGAVKKLLQRSREALKKRMVQEGGPAE